jgi:hypothetical protein
MQKVGEQAQRAIILTQKVIAQRPVVTKRTRMANQWIKMAKSLIIGLSLFCLVIMPTLKATKLTQRGRHLTQKVIKPWHLRTAHMRKAQKLLLPI